jgi:hypothetical protein
VAVSAKQRREASLARQMWRADVSEPCMLQRCMLCGDTRGWLDLQVHEIERGRWRYRERWYDASNLLLLCPACHDGPVASMSHANQLAYKLMRDPGHYDLERWLRIKDPELRAPNRVTQSEVDAAVKDILAQGAT